MRRNLLFLCLAVVGIGGPIAISSADRWWPKLSAMLGPAPATGSPNASAPSPGFSPSPAASAVPAAAGGESKTVVDQVPVLGFADAIRFDITIGWLLSRWPRVSTGLADVQHQGYRVPLVTGTGEDDVAGALTYYFNARQQVQRITFKGSTGNPKKLVEFLVSQYRLGRRLTNDPSLFRYEVAEPDGVVKSSLELRSAKVVKASDPYRRFDVVLVLERPSVP